jgi:hypothetical protein
MKGISSENQRDLILSVGVHKGERQLSPLEVAELLKKAVDSGTTIKELSAEIMLDSTMIFRFLRLSNLSPEIQHLVDWGGKSKISFSTASEIARSKTVDEQNYLGRATLENNLSKNEVIQIIETRIKFGRPISDCVEEIIKMRPQTIRRYLFIGGVQSSEVRDQLASMTQKERDFLFGEVIRSVLPGVLSCEGQLGKNRFSLIGNEDLDLALSRLTSDFESIINKYLELRIHQNG